jgi:hypothetical protein
MKIIDARRTRQCPARRAPGTGHRAPGTGHRAPGTGHRARQMMRLELVLPDAHASPFFGNLHPPTRQDPLAASARS